MTPFGPGHQVYGRGLRIFRFEVPVDDQWHPIKLTGSPISVGCRDPRVVEFWAIEADPVHSITRQFRVVGTGQPLPEACQFWGTAVAPGGALVWHLVELR